MQTDLLKRLDFSGFYENSTKPEGIIIAHLNPYSDHQSEWQGYWQNRISRVLALKFGLSKQANYNVGLEKSVEGYVDAFWRQDKELADQSNLTCAERTPIVIENGNSFVILPRYNPETGEEYKDWELFSDSSAPFTGFLNITQLILMDTALSHLTAHEKQDYLRKNGQRIREALVKSAIFDPNHHYILIKNPGQSLRGQEVNHPKYSELELESFNLISDKTFIII